MPEKINKPKQTGLKVIKAEAEREQIGISKGLVRLSAGIEDHADIQADLEQALQVFRK